MRAEDSDGASEWIHGPNFTTRSSEDDSLNNAPPVPTNLRFDTPTDSSCTVRWDASDGATDYDVNYKPAVGGRWTNEPHRGIGLSNTIHDLQPNTEYRWAVRSENENGASEWVLGENFTTAFPVGDGEFNIDLVFVSNAFTPEDKQLIEEVVDIWEQIIVADLPDYEVLSSITSRDINIAEGDRIDDLRIYVDQLAEDERVAGKAASLLERQESGLPVIGKIWLWPRIRYSSEGNRLYRDPPDYQAVAGHEIAHVLGIGTISAWWNQLEHEDEYENDPHFTGPQARSAFNKDGGLPYKGAKVPVNLDLIHWDSFTMPDGILTASETVKISSVTVGALADFGYQVRPSPTEFVPIIPITYGRGADDNNQDASSNTRPFNIEFVFLEEYSQSGKSFTDKEWEVIKEAGKEWEKIIVGDLPDHTFTEDSIYRNLPYEKGAQVDDIRIFVETIPLSAIEEDRVIGYGAANYETRRLTTGLPSIGHIGLVHQEETAKRFDTDWDDWRQLVMHQIGHALGIGSGNAWYALLEDDGQPYNRLSQLVDVKFVGKGATRAFNLLTGLSDTGVPVVNYWPLDHWDPQVLPNDLMSLDPGRGHLGRGSKKQWQGEITSVTINALADLGYTVSSDNQNPAGKPVVISPSLWCGTGRAP